MTLYPASDLYPDPELFPDGGGAVAIPEPRANVRPAGPGVDVTIRLQALDGTWETCGADRAIGVIPESVTLTANEWGPDTASFDLRRDPGAIWPDLAAFGAVEVEIGGVVVWRGRIRETPIKDGADPVVNVQCEGWQYHLDDDVYQRTYVHTRLNEWRDQRSFLTARLGANANYAAGQVTSDGGIVLQMPDGQPLQVGTCVGVVLDLGPNDRAAAIAIEYESSANTDYNEFYVRAANAEDWGRAGAWTNAFTASVTALGRSGAAANNFPTPHRYVHMFLWTNTPYTPNGDVWVKIRRVQVFTAPSYRSGAASALRASTVINDALDQATMMLSRDRSQIQPSSYGIPDFAMSGQRTPREVMEAVNAMHNWVLKVDLAGRLVFRPRPSAPELEIGAWSGAEFVDAAANSGAAVYNRAIVDGTGPDNARVTVQRSAADQPDIVFTPVASPAPVNPRFDVDTSGWEVTSGRLERDTTVFASPPASGKWSGMAPDPWAAALVGTFRGTFRRGISYRVTLRARATVPDLPPWYPPYLRNEVYLAIAFGDGSGGGRVEAAETWQDFTAWWTPVADADNAELVIFVVSYAALTEVGPSDVWIDDVSLAAAQPTLVDRRGFRRTRVIEPSFALTPALGQQLADVFLDAHRTTPLKGAVKVAPGGCRTVLGGAPVHPSALLGRAQELLRLSHRIDPDTGAVGRAGIIAQVSYQHRDQTAMVDIDDPRRNFEALLRRLEVTLGAGS